MLALGISAATLLAALLACRNGSSTPAASAPPRDSQQMITAEAPREPQTLAALATALWPGAEIGDYVPFSNSEKQALAAAVVGLWQENLDNAAEILPLPETVLARYRVDAVDLAGVVGSVTGSRGRGVYLVRVGTAHNVLLQAPHPYFDQFTEQIALSWLVESPIELAPHGLFAGSIHRYWQPDGKRGEREVNVADVCHNEAHEFTVVTAAVAANQPRLTIVQLHGFGGAPAEFDIVVSSGTATPSPAATKVAAALREAGYKVGLYPIETKELGATTNAQRRTATPLGAAFVHIELSRGVREALQAQPVARAAMWENIATSL